MNLWLIADALENTPPQQGFVYAAMLITVTYALLRTAGNLSEMRRLRRFGQRRTEYYSVRVWGASSGVVRLFLVAECLTVDVLSVLVVRVLSDVTL
ncbi:hypothetical protein [Pantoea sp. AS142]|uniref:hypothetical protein n=1 Tax=Pantoea sp. AS142 TaxID=3081292 RepID=UPI003015F1A7